MILDLFAGAGGWDVGAWCAARLMPLGIEVDRQACETRHANGLATLQADIATLNPHDFDDVVGIIASPPCPDWSQAGGYRDGEGKTGWLTDVVPDWVVELKPTWIACEQVPPALKVWEDHASVYEDWGYHTWTGILNSADYGVPQTRSRALLVAHRLHETHPPEPTHSQTLDLFADLEPWVTMADVLGPRGALRPGTYKGRPNPLVKTDRPGPTMAFGKDAASWRWSDGSRLTPAQAATIQSFPSNFKWRGSMTSQFKQIGNAVPPLLAQRVLEALNV